MLYLFILSIIQGITEFLPISSSAHLILLPGLTGNVDQGPLIDVAAHFGTLLAILIYFHKESKNLFLGLFDLILFKKTENQKLCLVIILSAIPVLIAGGLLKIFGLLNYLRDIRIIAFTSIFFGIFLFVADKRQNNISSANDKLNFLNYLILGLSQMLAIFPGTSRSGITMTTARFLGYTRQSAAKVAILMAIPVLSAFGLYAFYELLSQDSNMIYNYTDGIFVMLLSFIMALITLFFFIKFINKIGFLPFVIYRIALGIILFIVILQTN